MSERPRAAYGTGDTGLVSHDVEPAERLALRFAGDWNGDVMLLDEPINAQRALNTDQREIAEAIRARDATLRLAVLEEAARACSSEADARAVRELKRRPAPASTS